MTTKEDYSERDIIKLNVTKNLIANTDSPIEVVKEEFEKSIESIGADINDRFEASPYLTDGYHAEKKELEAAQGD